VAVITTVMIGVNVRIRCADIVIQPFVRTGGLMAKCEHAKQANPKVQPSGDVCQGCIEAGQRWVELRQCLICGNVGCCDSSPGRHATKHFKDTGHPVMQAFKSGDWKWCYVHEEYM